MRNNLVSIKNKLKNLLVKYHFYKISRFQNRFFIIAYHMISDKPNGFYPETSFQTFDKNIAHFAKNYRIISLHQLIDRIQKKESVRRCVAITFDDGFKDNYEKAYPILIKYNIPATIFLTTGYIDSGIAPWFIRLRHMFMTTQEKHFHFQIGNQTVDMPMRSPAQKFECSDLAMTYFKTCPDRERFLTLDRLALYLGANGSSDIKGLMLSWDQVREMERNGISFGAHTVNHPVLSRVGLDVVEREIQNSKTKIEEETGKPITAFAYPFGRRAQYPQEIFPILKRVGFTCAVTTEPGSNDRTANPYELGRSVPWELSLL